jgi:hypothetical protein
MPNKYLPAGRTVSLDELLEAVPDWLEGKGPEKYGRYLPGHEVVGGAGAAHWDEDAWLAWLARNPDVAAKVDHWDD